MDILALPKEMLKHLGSGKVALKMVLWWPNQWVKKARGMLELAAVSLKEKKSMMSVTFQKSWIS